MDVYNRMQELGVVLPKAPAKGGTYAQVKRFGQNLIYVSGCGPNIGEETFCGKVGRDYSLEEGQKAAGNCVLNILAILHENIGDLNKVKNVVKILTMVACADDFYDQPKVANGGTNLLIGIFGEEAGAPSRSAIGVNALPGNIPVESEAIFEIA
jgi:enamine deaminase RidA (YjgF/YER057c/UK114 family)